MSDNHFKELSNLINDIYPSIPENSYEKSKDDFIKKKILGRQVHVLILINNMKILESNVDKLCVACIKNKDKGIEEKISKYQKMIKQIREIRDRAIRTPQYVRIEDYQKYGGTIKKNKTLINRYSKLLQLLVDKCDRTEAKIIYLQEWQKKFNS